MKYDARISILLFVYLSVVGSGVSAQLPLPAKPVYIHYNSYNSGLPSELVYKVIADKHGYIWLATDKGLVRYNGKDFKIINTEKAEDFVTAFKTTKDILWAFAYSGRTLGIDLNTQKVINTDSLYGLAKLPEPHKAYGTIAEVNDTLMLIKNLTVAIVNTTLGKSIAKKWARHQMSATLLNRYRIPVDKFKNLHAQLDSILNSKRFGFQATDSSLTIRNKIFTCRKGAESKLLFDGEEYGITDYIMGFARKGDDLYIGGLHEIGLARIIGFFSLPKNKQHIQKILPKEQITGIASDYRGNIWVVTYNNGLFLFPDAGQHVLYYNREASGLHNNNITMIRSFPPNLTIIGYDDGVTEFYTPTALVKQFTSPSTLPLRRVRHIERTNNNWYLFLSGDAFYSRYDKDSNPYPDRFTKIIPNERYLYTAYRDGSLFNNHILLTSSSNLIRIDATNAATKIPISEDKDAPPKISLLPITENDFYIGTLHGCYYNNKKLPYLRDLQITRIRLVNNRLIFATNKGLYAIPTHAIYDRNQLRLITPDPGYDIKYDSTYMYLRCNDELLIIQNNTLGIIARFSFKKFAVPLSLNDFYVDSTHIILAGNNGIFYIPKKQLLKNHFATPQLHILCSLNDYSPADTTFKCLYRKELSVSFELDILDYTQEEKQIRYRLIKNGKEIYTWVNLKQSTQINFQQLSPGDYSLQYNVRSLTGQWEKTVSYRLIITPRWYQQWWLRVLFFAALLLLCILIVRKLYKYRVARNYQRFKEQLYIQELESQSLFEQLKPHFIFNVLAPLQGYFLRGEKIEGLNYLDNFSSLMRNILNSIRDKQISLKNELTFITLYLQIQQRRFNHCFAYQIRVDPAINQENYLLPSLLVQPLVENAVEHGIIKDRADGRIDIVVEQTAQTIRVTVTNNGIPLPEEFSLKNNHALQIIHERMQLLKKLKGHGDLNIFGAGPLTKAVLIFPKETL